MIKLVIKGNLTSHCGSVSKPSRDSVSVSKFSVDCVSFAMNYSVTVLFCGRTHFRIILQRSND